MTDFILSATSTVDIDEETLDKLNIKWIPFNYEIDGVEYQDDFGKTIKINDFYERMVNGAITKTSQITYSTYLTYFRKLLDEGYDILHLCLSSGITGEYNQALMARDMLKEEYPEKKVYVVDSLTATSCQGLLLLTMQEKKEAGMSIEELYEWTIENRNYINGWFFTSDLTYLVRGGRVSKAAGSFGNLLSICPLIEVNAEGKLEVREKIRTKKKACKALIKKLLDLIEYNDDYINDIYIVHTHLYDDAEDLKETIKEKLPAYADRIKIFEVGTTIGAHLGPGTLGVIFWGKKKII